MSACAMMWPRQEELEWSGCLLGNVVLMYDGVSALCLPSQTVLEVESVAGFLTVHFSTLCYSKPHLRTRNSLLSQLSNKLSVLPQQRCSLGILEELLVHGGGQQLFSVSLVLSFARCRLLMTSIF